MSILQSGKNYRAEKTGKKITLYDEVTGKPYKVDETKLVEDPRGLFTMVTNSHPFVMSLPIKK